MNTLLIVADLTNKPTETIPFRNLTYISKTHLKLDIILEVEAYSKDIYWKSLLNRGFLDYISYLIEPNEKEECIRIDNKKENKNKKPYTILTNNIRFENEKKLMGMVKYLAAN